MYVTKYNKITECSVLNVECEPHLHILCSVLIVYPVSMYTYIHLIAEGRIYRVPY